MVLFKENADRFSLSSEEAEKSTKAKDYVMNIFAWSRNIDFAVSGRQDGHFETNIKASKHPTRACC